MKNKKINKVLICNFWAATEVGTPASSHSPFPTDLSLSLSCHHTQTESWKRSSQRHHPGGGGCLQCGQQEWAQTEVAPTISLTLWVPSREKNSCSDPFSLQWPRSLPTNTREWGGDEATSLRPLPRVSAPKCCARAFLPVNTSFLHESTQRVISSYLPGSFSAHPTFHPSSGLPGLHSSIAPTLQVEFLHLRQRLPPPILFLPIPAHVFLFLGMFEFSLLI